MKNRKFVSLLVGIFVCFIIVGCAQHYRTDLTPLDQAKLNIKIYRLQLQSISNEIDRLSKIATTKKGLLLLQKADLYLKKANEGLILYTKNVKQWDELHHTDASFYVDTYNFNTALARLVSLLNDLLEMQKKGEL